MKVSIPKKIDETIPFPLVIILLFIIIELLITFSLDLIFAILQYFLLRNPVFQTDTQTLFVSFIGKITSIILILFYMNKYYNNDYSHSPPKKYDIKQIIIAIISFIALILLIKRDGAILFTNIFGLLETQLFLWPIHIFETESNHIPYLIYIIVLFVLIQPLWQELLFRKMLITSFTDRGFNAVLSIILSAFVSSIYLSFYILIEISLNDTVWFIITSMVSGLFLGAIYYTSKSIRYNYLANSISSLLLLLLYLSMNHFEFKPFKNLIFTFCRMLIILVIFILIYQAVQLYFDRKITKSVVKEYLRPLLVYTWPKSVNIHKYFFCTSFFLPLIPFFGVIFVNHTILYTDIWALIIRNTIIIFCLMVGICIFSYRVLQFSQTHEETDQNTVILQFSLVKANLPNINGEFLRQIARTFISQVGMILLVIGIISPYYILSVTSRGKIQIIILWEAFVNSKITIAQSPFLTFQGLINDIRSNIIFIGNQIEISDQLLFLQQSPGQWNFLPDTYMTNNADWFHGLVTVCLWIFILILSVYIVRRGSQFPLRAVLGGLVLIGLDFIWILLSLGFGSVSEPGGPPSMPALNQTSLLIQFDIDIQSFVIYPIGILLLFIGSMIILINFFLKKKGYSDFILKLGERH